MPQQNTQRHVYPHSWELMLASFDARFPTHPRVPELLSTVISARAVSAGGAREAYHRETVCGVDVPWMIKRAVGIDTITFQSECTVDHEARTLELTTQNVTFRDGGLSMDEVCKYAAHPDDPNRCYFEQTATLTVNISGLQTVGENFLMMVYKSGIDKGRLVDEDFALELLQTEADGAGRFTPWATRHAAKASPAALRTSSGAEFLMKQSPIEAAMAGMGASERAEFERNLAASYDAQSREQKDRLKQGAQHGLRQRSPERGSGADNFGDDDDDSERSSLMGGPPKPTPSPRTQRAKEVLNSYRVGEHGSGVRPAHRFLGWVSRADCLTVLGIAVIVATVVMLGLSVLPSLFTLLLAAGCVALHYTALTAVGKIHALQNDQLEHEAELRAALAELGRAQMQPRPTKIPSVHPLLTRLSQSRLSSLATNRGKAGALALWLVYTVLVHISIAALGLGMDRGRARQHVPAT